MVCPELVRGTEQVGDCWMKCNYCFRYIDPNKRFVRVRSRSKYRYYHPPCAYEAGIDITNILKIPKMSEKEKKKICKEIVRNIKKQKRSKEEAIRSFEETVNLMELLTKLKQESKRI